MNEKSFLTLFEKNLPKYEAMGQFVKEKLSESIRNERADIDKLLKIEPQPRIKETSSLIGKAFHRGKHYSDPYNEITDKVGIRFIVLTLADVCFICKKIEDIDIWDASLDKDFEEERNNNPHVFDYQSKHYVVKLKNNLEYQDTSIEKGTACEIQVRTLMQHAYSELSHDVLYKPKSTISKKTTRSLTRSVALIETVDEYFSEASKSFEVENSLVRDCFLKLKALYQEKICTSSYDIKTNIFLLSHFENKLDKLDFEELTNYFDKSVMIVEAIKVKSSVNFLYQQPVILFLYYLVGNKIDLFEFRDLWPLDESMIKPIFIDFGDSLGRYN